MQLVGFGSTAQMGAVVTSTSWNQSSSHGFSRQSLTDLLFDVGLQYHSGTLWHHDLHVCSTCCSKCHSECRCSLAVISSPAWRINLTSLPILADEHRANCFGMPGAMPHRQARPQHVRQPAAMAHVENGAMPYHLYQQHQQQGRHVAGLFQAHTQIHTASSYLTQGNDHLIVVLSL